MRLAGKGVAVVGVGPGLGSAVAHLAVREGARVFGIARTAGRLAALARELGLAGYGAFDFSRPEEAARGAEEAARVLGSVDGLAVTAGGYVESPVESLGGELDQMLAINLKAHLYAVRAFLPYMRAGSSVVLVSSIGGAFAAWPRHAAYVASKAALAKAVEVLAAELLPRGIRVNGVAPGSMMQDFKPGLQRRARLGEVPAPPEEVAKAIVWLLTDEASWVTGAVIPVDGGQRLR